MDVGDDRHIDRPHDRLERERAFLIGAGDATSVVGVLVIVCTLIGAPPPTGTGPTWMRREARRSMCW
jgi:hypothetical protein